MAGIIERLRAALGRPRRGDVIPGETDTAADPHTARTRATGGEPGRDEGDTASTTGPGANGEFVGRVAGNDDVGAVGETGAEARAEAERD